MTAFVLFLFIITNPLPQEDLEREAREAVAAQRFEDARGIYRRLSEREPQNMEHVIWIGRISGWLQDYPAALAAFDLVLERDPANAEALVGKAYILMYQNDYQNAEELLLRAEEIAPNSIDLQLARARSARFQGDDDEARRRIERVLTLDPANSEAKDLREEVSTRRFQMTMGYGQDRFSYVSPANMGSLSLGYVGNSTRVSVQYEAWDKFGDTAHRGGFSFSQRAGDRLWLRLGMMLSPRTSILAQQDYTGGFAISLPGQVVFGGDYRHMQFADSKVRVANPTIEYYFEAPIWLQAAYYHSWTDYNDNTQPNTDSSSYLFRYNHEFASRLILHLGYARGTENFSTLSIDRIGNFKADTYSVGADVRLSSAFSTGAFYAHQRRSNDARQDSFGVSLTVRR